MRLDERELYQFFFEHVKDVLYLIDARGAFVQLSPSFEVALGWKREAWMGRHFRDLLHPDDLPKAVLAFETNMRGQRVERYELRVRAQDGSYRVAEITSTPLVDQNTVLGVLGIARDITQQKETEGALRSVEKRYRDLVTKSPMGVFQVTMQGEVFVVNDALLKILELNSAEEFASHGTFPWCRCPEDATRLLERLKTEGSITDVEVEAVARTGAIKILLMSATLEGTLLSGTVIDLTDRKRAEMALQKTQAHLMEAQRIAQLGSWDWNIVSNELWWSDEIYRIFGLAPQEFGATYEAFLATVHPDDRDFVRESVNRALYEKAPYSIDHRIVLPDGTEKVVHEQAVVSYDNTGTPVRMTGTVQDITARIRMEEATRLAEERYRQLVELSPDAIFVHADLKIVFTNPAGLKLLGASDPYEVLGKSSLDFIHPDDLVTVRQRIATVLEEQRIAELAHIKVRRLDGTLVDVEIVSAPYSHQGRPAILAVARDITERIRAEKKLSEQHQTLQTLAAVGQTLTSSLDLNAVLPRILNALVRLFNCNSCAILLYDEDAGTLSISAQVGYEHEQIDGLVIHVATEGVTGLAVQERRTIYVPDVTKEQRYIQGRQGIRSELAFPLIVAGYVIGVLDVQDERVDAFDQEKIAVLQQFADYAAVAIENVRLFQQTQWQLKELFVINEIMRLSQSGLSFEEVSKAAAEALSRQFDYYCVSIFIRTDEQTAKRICSFGEGSSLLPKTDVIPVKECLIGKVLETRKPIIVNDLGKEPQYAQWVGSTTQARLCVPIKRGTIFVGAINIDSKEKNSFQRIDVATVSTIAAQLSAADERIRLLDEIRASEQKYINLYEDAPDLYFTIDENGIILMCNTTMAKMLGFAKAEIVGHSFVEFMPKESGARCREILTTMMKQNNPDDVECQLRRRDGVLLDVLLSIRVERVNEQRVVLHVSGHDVTEKKRTEQELLNFAYALSQTVDSVIVTDRNGVIQYVNSAFEQTTGFTKQEAVGKTPRILKSEHHPKEFYEELWKTILAGKVFRATFLNRRKTGELYYEERTITPVFDRFGNVMNFVSTGRDISEKRKLEQHVMQVQKMESIGTLASGIAHDFNNILAGIGAYTELLERRPHEQRTALWYAKQIEQLKLRGEELTRLLLSFVRREEQQLQPVNIEELIAEIALLSQKTFPKTIEITVKSSPEPLWVQGNRTELYQVLLNLCINARDAMPQGGILSIEAARGHMPATMQKSLLKAGHATSSCVNITVADTGVGIPVAVLDKIFDPFFTTKAPGKGTGLGLSVAYNIVRNHNGFIDVRSEEGRGTTFIVVLPAAEPPSGEAA